MSQVKDLDLHMNLAILGFAAAISRGAALAFGLAPALQSNRVDPWATLKEARLAGGRAGWFTPTRFLVVTQTTLSMVLLVASGLLLRTFLNLKAVKPGFDEQVLQANLDTALLRETGVNLGNRVAERIAQVHGVESVSFSRFGPIWGTGRECCIAPEGYTPAPNEDKNVRSQVVSPGYFRTLGIALLAGRDFAIADRKGSPDVAIVNDTMARHYFGAANPVGRRFGWSAKGPKDVEIVGVVRDAKYATFAKRRRDWCIWQRHKWTRGRIMWRSACCRTAPVRRRPSWEIAGQRFARWIRAFELRRSSRWRTRWTGA